MEIKQKYKYLIKGGRHTDLKFVGETNDVGEANQIIQDYINKHIKKMLLPTCKFTWDAYMDWLWKLEWFYICIFLWWDCKTRIFREKLVLE